jgi:hypothetical protein
MVLRLATLPPTDRMSIIESDQPLAVGSVQRQRIIEAVRLLRRHRHPSPGFSIGVAFTRNL